MKDNWFIEDPVLRKQYLSLSEEDKAQTRKAAIEMQKQLIFSEPWHLDGFSEKDKKAFMKDLSEEQIKDMSRRYNEYKFKNTKKGFG
mgnify:FL=1|tara:strand:+ start:163 stop:423 length:261 start_codon:yes stop_codon:yes gene_type:complete